MNILAYCYHAFLGLAFCLVLTARITFGKVETVSWPLWILGGVAYFIAIKFLWRVIQRKLFGDFLVVDVTKFVSPPVCATCFKEATETRTAFFSSTNAGPIPIREHAELPLKLCAECARRYDSKLLKGIKGIRISRVIYEKWTVQIKNRDYFNAVLELNRQSGAVTST
ncbi:MAG: hypothetical protein ACLPYZ_15740 [Limisphaerales bacterium]